jgi:hypothetical protein
MTAPRRRWTYSLRTLFASWKPKPQPWFVVTWMFLGCAYGLFFLGNMHTNPIYNVSLGAFIGLILGIIMDLVAYRS